MVHRGLGPRAAAFIRAHATLLLVLCWRVPLFRRLTYIVNDSNGRGVAPAGIVTEGGAQERR